MCDNVWMDACCAILPPTLSSPILSDEHLMLSGIFIVVRGTLGVFLDDGSETPIHANTLRPVAP